MKSAYPIILTLSNNEYVVSVPDLNINTQGTSIAEAIEMARDAIGTWGCYEQDEKRAIPSASLINAISHEDDEIVTLVDIDFDEYRRKHENRVVRKNLTIPSWLNEAAERENINFSAVLQAALKEQLHISSSK